LAASTFNSDHHEVEIDISLLDKFEDFVNNIDQPIGDSSYLMTSEICKNASTYRPTGQAGMKILLSGAGADEIFAGYNRHYAYFKYLNNQKALKALMPLLAPIITNLPAGFPHPFRKKFQLAKKWANSYDSSPIKTYLNYLSFDDDTSKSFSTLENQDLLKWALNHDQKNYLVSDILALSDKASMQHGIELRVPYLNEKLVNYLDAFPSDIRIRKGQKWILKSILSKYGGAKIVNRAKEGFGLPLSHWLFNNRVNHLWERIENNKSILFDFMEREYLKEVIKKQKNKSEDHGPYLWSVLVLEHWLNQHFA
jgi:asparagine synthase (glutamine-hydrolysing)